MDGAASQVSNINLNLTASELAAAQKQIEHTGLISYDQCKIALAVIFAIASASFIARICLRLSTRHRLYLDDGFLFLAFACLCGASAIMFKRLKYVYLEIAVLTGLEAAYALAYKDMDELVAQLSWEIGWLVMCWTSIFAVKWCYFAFFFPLLRNMSSWFIWYYRIGIFLSVACWITICVAEQLIACPYLGKEAGEKCFPKLPTSKTALLVTFWVWPILDVIVDIIIVSIPILLLRRVQLDAMTKIGIGCFVCLSVFMSACAITRAAGTYYHGSLDYPWQNFWLHVESCIAVLMASITAYRSTLIGSNETSGRFQVYFERLKQSMKKSVSKETAEKSQENSKSRNGFLGLPRLPEGLATFSGVKTRFGLQRTRNASRLPTTASVDSGYSDYHAFLTASLPPESVTKTGSPFSREVMGSMGSSTSGHTPKHSPHNSF